MLVFGGHTGTKKIVTELLLSLFGRLAEAVIGPGDTVAARGTERLLPIRPRLRSALGHADLRSRLLYPARPPNAGPFQLPAAPAEPAGRHVRGRIVARVSR